MDAYELLQKPYLRCDEVAKVLGCSKGTVTKMIKDFNLKRWPWGISTDELIEKLDLKAYMARMKKSASRPKQSA